MTNNPYLDPQRVRAALNAVGVRPSRELGQNFLTDAGVLAAIVDAAGLGPEDTVVEVGPGLGVLTYELVARAGQVLAIEFDRRLAERLPAELRAPNLRVVQADVLRTEPASILGDTQAYKVVANLPYHITSAVLRHFLEAALPPHLMVVMVQLEVAARIVAMPPDMSVLAHSIQYYARPELVTRVPAAAFVPSPKVDSAVLRIVRRPTPAVDVDDVDALFRIIKAGFLHARKKLSNSLPGGLAAMGTGIPKEAALAVLREAGVDGDRRAETVTLEEWARIYEGVRGHSSHRA